MRSGFLVYWPKLTKPSMCFFISETFQSAGGRKNKVNAAFYHQTKGYVQRQLVGFDVISLLSVELRSLCFFCHDSSFLCHHWHLKFNYLPDAPPVLGTDNLASGQLCSKTPFRVLIVLNFINPPSAYPNATFTFALSHRESVSSEWFSRFKGLFCSVFSRCGRSSL